MNAGCSIAELGITPARRDLIETLESWGYDTAFGAAPDWRVTMSDRDLASAVAWGGRPSPRPSAQTRRVEPEPAEAPHPRAVEMAERMREEAGAFGSCTYAGLIQAGFTPAEIVEHEPAARALAASGFARQLEPAGDRVSDIVEKAVAAAAHRMPRLAGVEPAEGAADAWGRYCAAQAARKLDPWIGQSDRCLSLLKTFLDGIGLLPRDVNRVACALAMSMKGRRG